MGLFLRNTATTILRYLFGNSSKHVLEIALTHQCVRTRSCFRYSDSDYYEFVVISVWEGRSHIYKENVVNSHLSVGTISSALKHLAALEWSKPVFFCTKTNQRGFNVDISIACWGFTCELDSIVCTITIHSISSKKKGINSHHLSPLHPHICLPCESHRVKINCWNSGQPSENLWIICLHWWIELIFKVR